MQRLIPYLWITCMGLAWGATLPLMKLAVSTGHPTFGLIFWQLATGAIVLGIVNTARRRPLPLGVRNFKYYLIIAFMGTLIPNTASYIAIEQLPAGIYAILIALVPMLALPMAIALGHEKFAWMRFMGLAFGLVAILLIIGVPEVLPNRALIFFVLIGMVAPMMYACEGIFVAHWGTGGAGPIQLLLGASIVGAIIAFVVATATGQFINPIRPWGVAEWALAVSSVIHIAVYTCYVLVIRRYGAVFGEQTGYIVTGAGVVWSIFLLGESYAGPVWIALALMLAGLYLVKPREVTAE